MSNKPLYVGRPNISSRVELKRRLDVILDHHWLTNNGQFVQQLESQLTEYLGVNHCVAICNGTVALELAIKALEMHTEVIVPSMTFIATAHALKWQGITPVFADISRQSYNLCPRAVESLITERTSGIIGVHLYGRACDIDALENLASKYQLKLAFDAAHAFGSAHGRTKLGQFGDCEVFSFHATKVFNTFEGGAITTNNAELANKLRYLRNFGFEHEDSVKYLGTNGKMAEVNAAMGLGNLAALPEFIERNRQNYLAYQSELSTINGVRLIEYDPRVENNYHYIIIEIEQQEYGASRDQLKDYLSAHDVLARRYFYPGCHRMTPYARHNELSLFNTEEFSERVLALPNGMQLDPERVRWVCELIKNFCKT